jgi:hypothetical protein
MNASDLREAMMIESVFGFDSPRRCYVSQCPAPAMVAISELDDRPSLGVRALPALHALTMTSDGIIINILVKYVEDRAAMTVITEDDRMVHETLGPIPAWKHISDGLTLGVWRDRFPKRPKPGEKWWGDDLFTPRDIHFAIDASDGHALARGKFTEWRANNPPEEEDDLPWCDFRYFFECADGHSTSSYEAAKAIKAGWIKDRYDEHPLEYGNLVIFERLRIAARSRTESEASWRLIRHLIKHEFRKKHRPHRAAASIMVLKPFPLAYEGEVTLGNRADMERAQRALMRLYRHQLGMQPLPLAKDGFMWRAINCPVEPPRRKSRTRK